MPLTDTAVRQAKPRSANYKLADAKGLYLLIQSKRREILALQVSLRWQREVTRPGVVPGCMFEGSARSGGYGTRPSAQWHRSGSAAQDPKKRASRCGCKYLSNGRARMVYEAEAHLGREPLDQSAVDAREESLSVARIPADFRNPS